MRVSRNDPCPCGSGNKYKRCCIDAPPSIVQLEAVAFGTEGTEAQRLSALQQLQELGVRKPGETVRIWQRGAWREIFLHEITEDAVEPLPEGELEDAGRAVLDAMGTGDFAAAERYSRFLLERLPGDPAIRMNLAAAVEAQDGRDGEGADMLRAIMDDHPRYLPARTGLAQVLLREERVGEARELFDVAPIPARVHPEHYVRFLLTRARAELMSEGPRLADVDVMLDTVEQLTDDPDVGNLRLMAGVHRLRLGHEPRGGGRWRESHHDEWALATR